MSRAQVRVQGDARAPSQVERSRPGSKEGEERPGSTSAVPFGDVSQAGRQTRSRKAAEPCLVRCSTERPAAVSAATTSVTGRLVKVYW